MKNVKVTLLISGRVQAVGYRFWARRQAQKLGLACEVQNLPNGHVQAILEGPEDKVEQMIKLCWTGPPLAKVTTIEEIS